MISHSEHATTAPYMAIHTAGGPPRRLSPQHLTFVAHSPDEAFAARREVEGRHVRPGQYVWVAAPGSNATSLHPSRVTGVLPSSVLAVVCTAVRVGCGRRVHAAIPTPTPQTTTTPTPPCPSHPAAVEVEALQGGYNPLTLEGTIVVDGVAASVFTADGGMSAATTHALLAPLRLWYRLHRPSYMAAHPYVARGITWLNDVPVAAATGLAAQLRAALKFKSG